MLDLIMFYLSVSLMIIAAIPVLILYAFLLVVYGVFFLIFFILNGFYNIVIKPMFNIQ